MNIKDNEVNDVLADLDACIEAAKPQVSAIGTNLGSPAILVWKSSLVRYRNLINSLSNRDMKGGDNYEHKA